ncbi:uncharacterized protein LOC113782345 [Coffea eugenioides]|uniref:uncharacterized protein LOC113782345 n=1 Tax=Coffea eugenioides TaxID=49369 RepID=UPI000F612D6B|nr:uncharacterized protein LOC113782345 [Coffea eugenioides]
MDSVIVNSCGSVWVFYDRSVSCNVVGESDQHVSVQIQSTLFVAPVIFFFAHAKWTVVDREALWAGLLEDRSVSLPWFVVGDFNVIVADDEKRGGRPFRNWEGGDLLTFMSSAGLLDAGFSGSRFTWCNNRQGQARIWKRLDRLLYDQLALDLGIMYEVLHLGRAPSDHAPLLMAASSRLDNSPKPFRFLNCWTSHQSFLEVIQHNWQVDFMGDPLYVLAAKLRKLKKVLREWSKHEFGDIFEMVKVAEQEVIQAENCFDEDPSVQHQICLSERRARLIQAQANEDSFWRQKARIRWLADGDKNSKFFHATVAERRSKSVIHRIKSSGRDWLCSEEDIGREAVSFFQGLFSDQSGTNNFHGLDVIPKVVTERDNDELERFPSLEEVKEVVFSMDADSAAGPDGFSGKFFVVAWEIVAEDVFAAVCRFFGGAELPKSITATSIVLVPKVSSPQDFSQFRPISLCSFVNKIISKLLARRLAKLLPGIISPNQSGFVQGRQMADNFLLAQELISGIQRPCRGGNVVLKLDMAKAYDRVSWPFLMQVLRRFGFGERWIDMIWRLVSNVWFSVIINGSPKGFFKSTRGLRQGDPISPALFVVGAEVLSRSLNALLGLRAFVPFKVPRGCPPITHLAYADDVIIFCSGLKASLQVILRTLDAYCSISGQQVNYHKSCFLVDRKLPLARKRAIARVTGFQERSFPIKYLGCPLYVGRAKLYFFSELCNLVSRRVLSWSGRLLSSGGVVSQLEQIFSSFLWGNSDFGPRFHWIKWAALTKPVEEGGAGLRSLQSIFDAFSLKLWWSFCCNTSIWASFMHAKYLSDRLPCQADVVREQSGIWRRLVGVKSLADSHVRWVLGNGAVDFWHENWMGSGPLCDKVEIFGTHSVANFVDQGRWNISMLRHWLPPAIVSSILGISPPVSQRPDEMVWDLTESGVFSIASAYQLVRQPAIRSAFSAAIWHTLLPSKVSFFMLRLVAARLPVLETLRRFAVHGPSRCSCCEAPAEETLDHIFCNGDLPKRVWNSFTSGVGGRSCVSTVRHALAVWWLHPTSNPCLRLIFQFLPCLVCWHLWRARNLRVFEGKGISSHLIHLRVVGELRDILSSRFPCLAGHRLSWEELIGLASRCRRASTVRWVKWRTSPIPLPKLNVDGCSRGNPGTSGGGGILRDTAGCFVFAFSCFSGDVTSLHSELRAMLYGVKLCVQRGIIPIHVESDSLLLVRMVRGELRVPWFLRREFEELIAFRHHLHAVTHCFREVNRVADRLSNVGADSGSDRVYETLALLPLLVRGDCQMDAWGMPMVRRVRP